jgi:hypothetical protein
MGWYSERRTRLAQSHAKAVSCTRHRVALSSVFFMHFFVNFVTASRRTTAHMDYSVCDVVIIKCQRKQQRISRRIHPALNPCIRRRRIEFRQRRRRPTTVVFGCTQASRGCCMLTRARTATGSVVKKHSDRLHGLSGAVSETDR